MRSFVGQGLRVSQRWSEVYEELLRVHPATAHWYLSLLGVEPTHQRSGVGSRLLSSWLESVDRDRAPSYLETDREENVAFYGREGFAVETELQVHGVSLWCMWRPARDPVEGLENTMDVFKQARDVGGTASREAR